MRRSRLAVALGLALGAVVLGCGDTAPPHDPARRAPPAVVTPARPAAPEERHGDAPGLRTLPAPSDIRLPEPGSEVLNVAFADDATIVATRRASGTVEVLDVARGRVTRSFRAGDDLGQGVTALAANPDVIAVAVGGGLATWDARRGERRTTFLAPDITREVGDVWLRDDHTVLAGWSGLSRQGVGLFAFGADGTTTFERSLHETTHFLGCHVRFACSPDGVRLAAGVDRASTFDARGTPQDDPPRAPRAGREPRPLSALLWTRDGLRAVTYEDFLGDRTLPTPLDVEDEAGAVRVRLLGHTGGIVRMSPSPDGAWLVTAGEDGRLFVWSTARFEPICRAELGASRPSTLAVSAGHVRIAVGTVDGEVLVYDAAACSAATSPSR